MNHELFTDQTIKEKLKEHFLSGGTITVLEAVTLFSTIDLRKYISTLRNEFQAEDRQLIGEWEKNESTKKKFKRYKLQNRIQVTIEKPLTELFK